MSNHKHLTKEDRLIIETGLNNGSSRKSIAQTLGKSPSTICKEVKLRSRWKEYHRPYMRKNGTYDCQKIEQCGYNGFCSQRCPEQLYIKWKRRDKTVGICKGCPEIGQCRLRKKFYKAGKTHENQLYTHKDSREGISLTIFQTKALSFILKGGTKWVCHFEPLKRSNPRYSSLNGLFSIIRIGEYLFSLYLNAVN